jgi:hypothetical protein
VELDFPQSKKLPAKVTKQNDKLQKEYKIEGFPTIIVLSPDGKELGRFVGYEGESPSEYLKKLDKVLAKQNSSK